MILTIVFVSLKKGLLLILPHQNAQSLHCNGNINYFYVNKSQIFEFKGLDNMPPYRFVSHLKIFQLMKLRKLH